VSGELVASVSDTARWVAHYRAVESARPDALFSDPLAARLAGTQGAAIAARVPGSSSNGWFLVARTRVIDDLIADCIASGCDRVLNLAAGLDTRPYRLRLPPSLSWIEADLAALVDEKERALAGETPVCVLTRLRVDLADDVARRAFLDDALTGARNALVITEGLLTYLEPAVVASLGRDFAERAAIRWWILDFTSPAIRKMLQTQMASLLVNAPMKFGPENGVAFFEELGWQARDVQSLLHAAARYRRLPWMLRLFARLPPPDPRRLGQRARFSAVVRLERRPGSAV
jgi:methyltransferase (TIGR00027 family)